jgi:hypothetical protein
MEHTIATDKPNPFSVLRISTDACAEDIVARGQELSDLADDDEQRLLVRWAVEALITHPHARAMYELFEMPATSYDEEAWARFARRHRRNPITLPANSDEEAAPVEAFDLVALIDALLDDLARVPEPHPAPALVARPTRPDLGPPTVGVWDVIFG